MTEKMYYAKPIGESEKPRTHQNRNATPLKVFVGDYEISLAGDDSCGAIPQYGRLSIGVFDGDHNMIEDLPCYDFDSFVEVVAKYRKIVSDQS